MRPRRLSAPASAPGGLPLAAALFLAVACSGSPARQPAATGEPQPGALESPAPGSGQPGGFVPDTKPGPKVRWVEAVVPKGTKIDLVLLNRLGSGSSKAGDQFRGRVTRAIEVGGTVAVPEGSNVQGEVREATPARNVAHEGGGSIVLVFSWIGTPTGATANIAARLSEVGGAAGARLAVTEAPGRSAITALAKGKDAVLEVESPIAIVLEEPLHIKVKGEGGAS